MAKKEVQDRYPNAYCKQYGGEGEKFKIYTQNPDDKHVGEGWTAQAAWHDAHKVVMNEKRNKIRKAKAELLKSNRDQLSNDANFRARVQQLTMLFDLNKEEGALLKETLILFATTINK